MQNEKVKLMYDEVFSKIRLAESLVIQDEKNREPKNKLEYAIQKNNKALKNIIDEYNEKVIDINVDLASVDKDGNIIKQGDGQSKDYVYTKENEKKRRDKINKLKEEVVEFTPFYFMDEDKIATFDDFVVEELRGFLFKPL